MAQGDRELATFAWLKFLVMILTVLLAGTASFLGVLLSVLGMLPGQKTKRYGQVAVLLSIPIFALLLYGALHPHIQQG